MEGNSKRMTIINPVDNSHNLKINDLKIGMVLAETIEVSENTTVYKNETITNEILQILKHEDTLVDICVYKTKKYYNPDFETSEDESLEVSNKYNNKKLSVFETVTILEKNFNALSLDLTQTFFKLGKFKLSTINEIRKITKQLQESMADINALINDIVLHGSGADSIYRHGINVALLSNLLGRWIGLPENKINLLTYSALLHDIGKIKIDSNILNSKASLSENEYITVKSHALIGYNIVKEINFLDNSVAQGILFHHERLDGSGYPFGLKNDNVSQFSKIIAIADVFDAINSNRPYRKKRLPFESLQIIRKESFGKLDYKYADIFLHHIFNYYLGKDVVLNNNKIAQIIQMDINALDRPLILLDDTFLKLSQNKDLDIIEFVL
jgi:putative nucleotidyltransferase with HDIG domain